MVFFLSFDLFIGLAIGFVISFLVLKRSINKTGYGELKLCKTSCPFYQSYVKSVDDEHE